MRRLVVARGFFAPLRLLLRVGAAMRVEENGDTTKLEKGGSGHVWNHRHGVHVRQSGEGKPHRDPGALRGGKGQVRKTLLKPRRASPRTTNVSRPRATGLSHGLGLHTTQSDPPGHPFISLRTLHTPLSSEEDAEKPSRRFRAIHVRTTFFLCSLFGAPKARESLDERNA